LDTAVSHYILDRRDIIVELNWVDGGM